MVSAESSPGLAERLDVLWNGPQDLPRGMKLEWRFSAVRWLGIASLAPGLLLAHLPPERLVLAYVVLLVASLYNVGLQRLMRRRPEWLANGYLSTTGDAVLDIVMVNVGGGFDSPFYLILFTVTIASAMRYGYGPSLGVSLLCVSADGMGYLAARQQVGGEFVVRSLLLPLTTILAGYLREQAHLAQSALEERLRQSNALNEVTGEVAASLELDAVLRAAAAATARLFGAPAVVLQPSMRLTTAVPGLNGSVAFFDDGSAPIAAALERLCAAYATGTLVAPDGDELIRLDRLPSGQRACLLELAIPHRNALLAYLAVALPDGPDTVDPDIRDAFVERVALAAENAALYRTLADRSHDLQRAYSDLATAHQDLLSVDEMKTSFLANVSHELRTPLTSIRSFSELLLAYEEDSSVQHEFLHIISTESERLTRLVNDVLDISRIEAGHMNWHMSRVDVGELLIELVRTFGPQIELVNLRFDPRIASDLPSVYGDRDRLAQVIANLLSNAMKFTQPGGTISLSAERVNDELRIAVTDTGVGIALHDQGRIFEKFQQLGDTLTDKPRGTGLGLPICRDILEHHLGHIWVESMPGHGSTFTVALLAQTDAEPLTRAA